MAVSSRPVAGQSYELWAADPVSGLGEHPLFQRGEFLQGFTVLVNGSSVEAVLEPVDSVAAAAEQSFRGGSVFVVDGVTAGLIFDAGFGRWLSTQPELVLDDPSAGRLDRNVLA